MSNLPSRRLASAAMLAFASIANVAMADEPSAAPKRQPTGIVAPPPPVEAPPADLENAEGLVRLHPKYDVWIDKARKRVVMRGEVCLRKGALELFACLKRSKEHEAILAVATEAHIVHAALLAVGAIPGNPVQYRPEFRPAAGAEVEVTLFWTDPNGKPQRARGQEWVRDYRTKKELSFPWVFAGSGFYVDEESGKRYYLAEDGDLICVSNFPSAMLDLPIESTQSNEGLLFEAYTDRIPEIGTPVTVVLTPKPDSFKPATPPASEVTPPAAPSSPK